MGPFSKYLTEPVKPSTPQPSGSESPWAGAAYIFKNFLDGARQTRLQKAAMDERSNMQNQQAYETLIDSLSKNSSVDPRVKDELLSQAQQAYLGHIGATKLSSKDTGNPLTDVFKNIAINLTGGQLPGKKAGLDMAFVGDAYSKINDPANQRHTKIEALRRGMTDLISSGKIGDMQTALQNQQIMEMASEGRRLSGDPEWMPEVIRSLPADPLAAMQTKSKTDFWKQVSPTAIPPVVAAPTDTTPSPAATTANIAGVEVGKPTSKPPTTIFQAIEANKEGNRIRRAMQYPVLLPEGSVGTAYTGMRPGGQSPERLVPVRGVPGFSDGDYSSSGELVTGAVPHSPINPNSTNKPLTAEQTSALMASVKASLSSIKDPGIRKAAESAVQAQFDSGDHRGTADVLRNYIQMDFQKSEGEANRAASSANREESKDLRHSSMAQSAINNAMSGPDYKNMSTAENYYKNAASAYQAVKNGQDPGIYDLELLRTWAKLTDITTGVREGEYRDLASAMGRIRGFNNSFSTLFDRNGGRMDEKMRNEVISSIKRIRDQAHQSWNRRHEVLKKNLFDQGYKGRTGLEDAFDVLGDGLPGVRQSGQTNATPGRINPGTPAYNPGASRSQPSGKSQLNYGNR